MANWGNLRPIITSNNRAVHLIKQGRYIEAQFYLTLALLELDTQTRDSSIMMNPPPLFCDVSCSIDPSTMTTTDSSTTTTPTMTMDEWMVASRPHDDDANQDSFYVYKEGIPIPTPLPCDDIAIQYKSLAFAIFFNQGLAHHLCCYSKVGIVASDPEKKGQMAASAHQLYRLAFQYRNENNSCESRPFLLAVCNNLAVLDRQWTTNPTAEATATRPATTSTIMTNSKNVMGPYFEYLQILLGNCTPSSLSTREEAILWNRYVGNVLLALGWFHDTRNHACAA